MIPEVQKTIDELNVTRAQNEEAITFATVLIDRTQDILSDAKVALENAMHTNTHINAQLALLFHQVQNLVEPGTTTPPVDPNAMPTTPAGPWAPKLAEDFAEDVPLGTAKTFFGRKGWQFYDGPTMRDTSRRGTYDTALAVSVQDGILTSRYGFKGAVPFGSAILPMGWTGQTYGRYAVRFRVDEVVQRKIAWLLWPANNVWNDGEIDFPEASAGGTIHGFNHRLGNPSQNQLAINAGVKCNEWHTAVIEWLPERLTFILDDEIVGNTTERAAIPRVPMRWVLQNETALGSTAPLPSTSVGNVQIAWLTVHSYVAP